MFRSFFCKRGSRGRRGKAGEESLLLSGGKKNSSHSDHDSNEATSGTDSSNYTSFTFEDGTTEVTSKESSSSYNLTSFTFADGTTEITDESFISSFTFDGETMESTSAQHENQSYDLRSFNISPKSYSRKNHCGGFSKLKHINHNEFAKQSITVKRSSLGYVEGDGDVWVEVPIRNRNTGVVRSFFISVETGERRRDEAPTGASRVIYLP